MGTDHETEAKLLASAKSEFLEKGYAKASLRKICANAGMTTGALYFFFKDKEDLFRSIVEKPFRELLEMMKIHFAEDAQLFSESAGYVHAAGDHEELRATVAWSLAMRRYRPRHRRRASLNWQVE